MKFLLLTVALITPSIGFAGEDLFSKMNKKLHYLSERHAVITKNIANANTPGYRAVELAPLDLGQEQRDRATRVRLTTTTSNHIKSRPAPIRFRRNKQKEAYETSIDGNNVVLEEQSVKMSQNNLEYRTTLNMMSKMKELLKVAIGDNNP